MRSRTGFIFRLMILLTTCCCIWQAAGADTVYVENEWNYMETAMDISKGIPEDADGDLARIERNGVLKVAADFDCAPLCFLDPEAEGDNQYAGLDMALAREIAKKMGVKLVIVPKKSIYKLPALMNDQVELTISAVTCTPGRALAYTMSNAYYSPETVEEDIGILVRKDKPITSLAELKNKKIAAQSNSVEEAFAAANQELKECTEFIRPTSSRSVCDMVLDGTVDAGIVNIRIADTYFISGPDSELMLVEGLQFPADEQYRGYRVAAKKGETQLIAFVNGVIEEAEKNGDLAKWLKEAKERAEELGLGTQAD